MERRKKGIVLILIAILIFGVFAGVEFFGKKEKKEPAQTSATAAIPSATPIPTSVVTITPKPPADAETEEVLRNLKSRFRYFKTHLDMPEQRRSKTWER